MDAIYKHFPDLPKQQYEQLEMLGPLYAEWNEKINVISRKDIDNLYSHHVLHSLAIAKYVSFSNDDAVIDVGTGGGFPGVPLAILFPDTSFTLLDSTNKKLTVVAAICAELGLKNVTTMHDRIEDIKATFDYAVSRAVTRLDTMWQWVMPRLRQTADTSSPKGLLYLKGGDISAELPNKCIVQQIALTTLINEPFFTDKALVHIYKK